MHEILNVLPRGARVLDLGAKQGSFDVSACPGVLVVRLDLDVPSLDRGGVAVRANASALPFRTESFNAVIANHSLEHVEGLTDALSEMGRVVRQDGFVYIAVPDSSTFSDRLYRWVFHGGGHVNDFESVDRLTDVLRTHISLPVTGCCLLYSSFGYLKRTNFPGRPHRRMWLFLNGAYGFVVALSFATRVLDRVFRSRLSVYGWSIYMGKQVPVSPPWSNVCVQCGAAHPDGTLPVRRRFGVLRVYDCPGCGSWNLFV